MTEQNETPRFILEKNLEAIKDLEESSREVTMMEVNGKQRLYAKLADSLYLAFKVDDNTNCSLLAINGDGDEFNLDNNSEIVINKDDLIPVENKIKDYFINFCTNIKTEELNGKIVASEDENRLKALQVIMSTQKYDVKDILELTKNYIEKLNLTLDDKDKKFGINNKALTARTGFIPALIASSVLNRVNNDQNNIEKNVHKLISELTLMEDIPDTIKGLALSVLREKCKKEYKSFFESNEYDILPLESRVLPVLILGRDINSKEMYNECVMKLNDVLTKTKEENKLVEEIANNYISIVFDMLNGGNTLNMQIGPMLNPLRPLMNCIEKSDDFFMYCDCISKNISDFNTIELDNKPISSGEIIAIYAKTNMINELNESNKFSEIFKETSDQEKIIKSFFESFNSTIIANKLDGGYFIGELKETMDILYKLNPEVFSEYYKNTIELAKTGENINIFYRLNPEEFFKKSKKELEKDIPNLLTEISLKVYSDDNNIKNFFEDVKKHGFKITDMVISTINNISEKKDIYPFIKEALITNLYLYIIDKGSKPNGKIKELVNSKSKEIKKKIEETVSVDLNNGNSIELFLKQREEAIESLKSKEGIRQDLIKSLTDELKTNKVILETIKKTIPYFKFYDEKNKEDSISSAGARLAYLLYDGNSSQDTLNKYFNSFESFGFPIGDVVISTAENLNRDKDIYPFIRKEMIENLFNIYTNYTKQQKKQLKIEDKTKEITKFGDIKNKINSERPITIKDKNGKAINIHNLEDENLLNLFLEQEERSINFSINKEKELSILNKNKTLIQNLKQNSPELFVKNNEKGISGISY